MSDSWTYPGGHPEGGVFVTPPMPTPPPAPPPPADASADLRSPVDARNKAPSNSYMPYQMAAGDRSPGDWGTDSYEMVGLANYPGIPEGPGIPDPRDMTNIIHNVTMGLGANSSPGVAMPMIQAGTAYRNYNGMLGQMNNVTPDMAKGMQARIQYERQKFLFNAERAKTNLEEQLREYGNAYAMYGPSTKDGKTDPGEPEKLHEEIMNTAIKHHDQMVINALQAHDFGAVDKLLAKMDGLGQDLGKTLDIELKKYRIEQLKEKVRKDAEKKQQTEELLNPFKKDTRPMPERGTPMAVDPGKANTDATGIAATPGEKAADPDKSTDFDLDNLPADPRAPKTEAAPDEAISPRSEAEPTEKQPKGEDQKPVQVAEADTGTMSDAPPSFAGRFPKVDTGATAQPPAPAATQGAPAAGPQSVPPAGVSAGKKSDDKEPESKPFPGPYKLAPSAALDAAHKAGLFNDELINEYALAYANHTMTIMEARGIHPTARAIISARSKEYEQEYKRVLNDPNIKGQDVIKAIASFDPYYANALSAYVGGRANPPQSAWQNAAYQTRTMALGTKVDPDFNFATFRNRLSLYNSYSHGPDARNITAVATLDLHARDMKAHMEELRRLDPYTFQLYTSGSRFFPEWSQPSKRVQELLGKLDAESQTVRDEFAKAISGASPHVGAQEAAGGTLDFRGKKADVVIATLDQMQHLAHRRMGVLVDRYNAGMGPTRGKLGELYESYAKGIDTDPSASATSPDVTSHVHEMIGDQRRSKMKIERID